MRKEGKSERLAVVVRRCVGLKRRKRERERVRVRATERQRERERERERERLGEGEMGGWQDGINVQ